MAEFLTTKQISSELEQLIFKADKILYLVSPYLKLSKDFQELLNSRNANKKETIIIYGKVDLTPEQLQFLTRLRYVYLKFHLNLHAKCYINDTKLIITSLNFFEYSMINNKEMGVLYDNTKPEDQDIYNKAFEHVKFIEQNSNDKPFELPSNNRSNSNDIKQSVKADSKINKLMGYCIRTGNKIPFDPKQPFTKEAFQSWSKFGNEDYEEKYCHFSGEDSEGQTSFSKPILRKNWKKAKELYSI